MDAQGLTETGNPQIELTENVPVLQHFEARIVKAVPFCSTRWEEALESQRFVYGGEHQWDAEDWKTRRSGRKPTFSMNDCALAVNAFSGKEITSRFQPTTLPRSKEDSGWNGVLREYIRKVRDQSYAENVESDKFRDLAMEGYGWEEWRPDYIEDPLAGKLKVDGISSWEMLWDPTARERCLLDREWDARGKFLSIDEYLALFPGKREEALGQLNSSIDGWIDPGQENISRWPWLYRAQGQYYEQQRREIFVADYQWREREGAYIVSLPPDPVTGYARKVLLSEEEFLELDDQTQTSGMPALQHLGPKDGVYRWRYRRAFIAGKQVIQEEEIPVYRFTRVCKTGFPYKQLEAVIFYSFLHYMKDPQKFQNEVISLSMSYLQRGPKSPLFYEAGAFEDEDKAAKQMSSPFPLIKMKRGGREKIQWGPDTEFPAAISHYLQLAGEAVWRPTGMSPQTLGGVSDVRRVSGEALSQIVAAGEQALGYLLDALKMGRKESTQLILAYLPVMHDEQSLAEIVGPEHAPNILPKDQWEESLKRDVIVEEVLSTKNEEEAKWDYFSRQGTLEKMVQAQLMPPQFFPKMLPSSWISEQDRKDWIGWLDARFGPVVPPPLEIDPATGQPIPTAPAGAPPAQGAPPQGQ